jgi:hypothetical protein
MAVSRASRVLAAALRSSALIGEDLLDRIEVRGVGRKEHQGRPGGFDRRAGAVDFMGRQIVKGDDVARREAGCEEGLGIGGEGVAVHRPVDDHGRGEAAEAQARDQGGGLPVTVRDRGAAPLAARTAPAQAGHLGGRAGLIEEDELCRVELRLEFEPGLAARGYIRARLLAGMRRLFLNVIPCRR